MRVVSRAWAAGVLPHMYRWPGTERARWVVDHADHCAESALESLGRFACLEELLPVPVSNAWVGHDRPVYRVDGLWPWHWAASEADGAIKYDDRPDASRIVAAKNEREWYLRRLGLDVARYDWALATAGRGELAARFGALLRDNPVRDVPIRWWQDVPGVGPVEPEPEDWPSPSPPRAPCPVVDRRLRHRSSRLQAEGRGLHRGTGVHDDVEAGYPCPLCSSRVDYAELEPDGPDAQPVLLGDRVVDHGSDAGAVDETVDDVDGGGHVGQAKVAVLTERILAAQVDRHDAHAQPVAQVRSDPIRRARSVRRQTDYRPRRR